MTPYRRCFYLDERGLQCEEWFSADTEDKLCPMHRGIASVSNNGSEENKVRYIDLANGARQYSYHFKDGTAQEQDQELIYQFKDDQTGTAFEKRDRHIAFLDRVLEDIKIRLSESRAVRMEALNNLTEEQRKELRKIKIDKALTEKKQSVPSIKRDPIAHLMKSKGISESDAKDMLSLDPDELIAKFKRMKEMKDKSASGE